MMKVLRAGVLATVFSIASLIGIANTPAQTPAQAPAILPAPVKPDPNKWSDNEVTVCWLGHATVLINFFGVRILTDPALGRRRASFRGRGAQDIGIPWCWHDLLLMCAPGQPVL